MSTTGSPIFKGLDMIAFSTAMSLAIIGWAMIYAVGYGSGYPDSIPEFLKTEAGKQAIFLGISVLLFISIMIIDWKFWRTFSNLIYIGSVLMLVAVLVIGNEVNGARSWFQLFGFSLQPSEIAKFGVSLALSDYLATSKVTSSSKKALSLAGVLVGIPILLILLQPDAGSAIVFGSFVLVLYRNGLSPYIILLGAYFISLFIIGIILPWQTIVFGLLLLCNIVIAYNMRNQFLWLIFCGLLGVASLIIFNLDLRVEALIGNAVFLAISLFIYARDKTYDLPITTSTILALGLAISSVAPFIFEKLPSHQQDRINVWLQPSKSDPHGSAYNLAQSKVAIGSGGFAGKGFLNGSLTKLNFVPAQSTDFIFSSVGEEHGFLGSAIVIGLFLVLLWRIIIIAEKQRSPFSRNYAYCVAGILFVHVIINIGMTMGMFLVIGIPLPFISYGGSSLIGFTLMLGVLLKLDQNLKSV